MATVNVTSWAEFVQAVGVSGDTVVLPNKAEWDINELYPEGYTGNITINCSEIDGNDSTIKNLHMFGSFILGSASAAHTIQNLSLTNFVAETTTNAFFQWAYGSGRKTLTFSGCILSGLCGTKPERLAQKDDTHELKLSRCSINISFTTSANTFGIFPVTEAKYCRLKQNVQNAVITNVFVLFGDCKFCEIDVYVPQLAAGKLNVSDLSACKLLGGYGSATFYANSASSAREFPSIYLADALPDAVEGQYMRGVTRDQMRDAEYLSSIGFPIGV